MFALSSRKYREIASITSSGHCVPPGPSKNASRRSSAEKRARTEAMSRAVVLMRAETTQRRPDRDLASARMERLRTLSEAECYERCYGWRHTEDTVKVLPRGGVAEVESGDVGERLRMLLELRIDAREPEAA